MLGDQFSYSLEVFHRKRFVLSRNKDLSTDLTT